MRLRCCFFVPILAFAPMALGQSVPDTVEGHRAAAKAAAGQDFAGLYAAACPETAPAAGRGRGAAPARRPDPPLDQWYAEPQKVFDNLYFIGTKAHGSWAVTTSDGIIVIDTLYSYAAEPEIVEGLRKAGLDPAQIKYVVVSHGHGDHDAGAKLLQDQFHAHIILSPADWELAERDTRNPIPHRDLLATDGEKLKLGDTTLTLYITPGHTPGTISTLVPVKDNGRAHLAVEWGGTALSTATPVPMIEAYIKSAQRFRDLAVGAGADVIITNHTQFDQTLAKLDALKNRKPGDPNPYVIGKQAVQRYLTVAEECGKAMLLQAR
ncbi:MAG TPA: MBL fold metallo-hydrolase [Bryobacteraceae bacterium]|nr:MBL fold metallo-hydrolase [Bryobacteraceae bacterium]